MTPRQIELVRTSFAAAAPVGDAVAINFYQRLFRRDPQLRGMFAEDMAIQRGKLIDTLAEVVADLDRPAANASRLAALGRHHAELQVEDGHYALVGDALIETLRDALGPRFTPETEAAWLEAYGMIARLMIGGEAATPLS